MDGTMVTVNGMNEEQGFVVDGSLSGTRLDVFLAEQVRDMSRSKAKRLIEGGFVTVDDASSKAHHILRKGETVKVRIPSDEAPNIEPEDIPLDVIHEDKDLLVVNKPPGMVVHPAAGNFSHTLVNALMGRYKRLSQGTHPLRPGIVHRLDKETSGCLVVAKNDVTHNKLMKLFADRNVTKEYRAIVAGVMRDDKGTIETLIDRSRRDRKRMAATADKGRDAVTHYRVIERFASATHVSAFPKTGRTHQIRVHFAHIGHPLLGDKTYGRGRKERKQLFRVPRHMLHSFRLGFNHPTSGEHTVFEAPLPEDFLETIRDMGKPDGDRG
jgi:23S rRNA pseudouridine1911/1915/1917 synthase